ncbi:MAG: hypothetical protein AB1650_05615 [Candidatus Omnitrophota bacterium]
MAELSGYLRKALTYSLVFSIIHIILDVVKSDDKNRQTVPFAPLIFLGTLATNTNLLTYAMRLLTAIKKP